jgi:iron complex outermembrane recepter protein
MSDRFIVRKISLLSSAALVLASTAMLPAYAQDAAGQGADTEITEEIVVTGSRITNPNLDFSSPVAVVGSDEFNFKQPVSAEQLLREVPGVVPALGQNVNNGSNGTSTLNLRGLGDNRNLVLLDGQRLVPAGTNAVADLNIIPIVLIERADIFTGGATTAYGADAIAGVVNFITKRNFTGIEISGNFGFTEEGDGEVYRTDATIGADFDGGRGNVVLNIGYTKTEAVLQGDRSIGRVSLSSVTGLPQGSATAVPASIAFPFSGGVNAAGNGFNVGDDQLNDFNFNPLNLFQTPFERFSIFGKAHYEVNKNVEFFTSALFSKTTTEQNIAPTGTFFTTFQVPLNNPFLSTAQRNQLCLSSSIAQSACTATSTTEVPVSIGRRFVEAGPRVTAFEFQNFQLVAGVRGEITSTISYEISGTYGESSRVDRQTGQALRDRVQQALRATNTTTCTVTTGGCVPINLFGVAGSITPEALAFIDVPTFSFVNTSLANVIASVNGDFGIASPFAEDAFSFAVGGEYRETRASSRGDGISSTPGAVLGAGAAALPVSGSIHSYEAFGEIVVPLVQDAPFVHNLSLEAGIRYSDFSTTGGNTTFKAGGSFAPIKDVRFRGIFTRSVRAPNINELFAPQVVALSNRATDPCQGTLAQIAARGVNQAVCAASLARSGTAASALGSIPAPTAGQINITQGGNPNLDPEKANALTLGVVLQPSFAPGLNITIDYYDIDITKAITLPGQADIVDGCFSNNTDPNAAPCLLILRNRLTGGLSGSPTDAPGVILARSNLGTLETNGIDLSINYTTDIGATKLNVNFTGNYTNSSKFQATPTSVNRECVGFFSVSCDTIQPEFSFNLRSTVTYNQFDFSLQYRFIDSVKVEPLANPSPASFLDAFERIKSFHYFDLSFRFQVNENLRLTANIANLFDKDPPLVGNTIGATAFNSGNTFPSTYDTLGRRFNIGATVKF